MEEGAGGPRPQAAARRAHTLKRNLKFKWQVEWKSMQFSSSRSGLSFFWVMWEGSGRLAA